MFPTLKKAVRAKPNYNAPNKELDIAIAEVKKAYPQFFHTQETLILRRFYHKPKHPIPYRSYEVGK